MNMRMIRPVCSLFCLLAMTMIVTRSTSATSQQRRDRGGVRELRGLRGLRASIARHLDGIPFTVLKTIGTSKQGQPQELFRVGRARVSPGSVRIRRSRAGVCARWSTTAMLDIIHVGLVEMILSGTCKRLDARSSARGVHGASSDINIGINRVAMQDRRYTELNGATIQRTSDQAIPTDSQWHAWLRSLDNPLIRPQPPLVPLGRLLRRLGYTDPASLRVLDVQASVLEEALRATQP